MSHSNRTYYTFRAPAEYLPPRVDLREGACFPYLPPRDQGTEGSCVSHSMGAAIECAQRRNGLALDSAWDPKIEEHFDKAFSMAGSDKQRNREEGLSFSEAIRAFETKGVRAYWIQPRATDMKQAIYSGYPVVFGYTVTKPMRDWQDAGAREQGKTDYILPATYASSKAIDGFHAVIAVGYDNAKQAFLVRNSWGESWGDRGHFWFPYEIIDADNGIVQDLVIIDLDRRANN